MDIEEIVWDEGNEEHLLEKEIIREEVEEIFFEDDPHVRNWEEDKYAVFGHTVPGRYLIILFRFQEGGKIRPFTGWEMSDKYKRLYKREVGL